MNQSYLERNIELYRIDLTNSIDDAIYNDKIILSEIVSKFFSEKKFDESNPKEGFKVGKEKTYWISYTEIDEEYIKVKFEYAIHNKRVSIVKIDDKTPVKRKEFDEGDLEKQHILIKFIPESNIAILVYERISNSVPISDLNRRISGFYRKYIKENYGEEIAINAINLNITPIASTDFLQEISNLSGISLIKLIVDIDKCSFDEDINFSQLDNGRKESEIIYKPLVKQRLKPSQAVKYCRQFVGDSGIISNKIKRIVINGEGNNKKVRLDTEGMKLCKSIKASLDIDRTVDSEVIFGEFETILNNHIEENPSFFNIVLS